MRRFVIASLVLLSCSWMVASQTSIEVIIDQDTRADWNTLSASFEAETGARVSLRPYPRNSLAQQVVLTGILRSSNVHFIMVPGEWATRLAQYLIDLAEFEDRLLGQGIEPVFVDGRPVGVPIPFAAGAFLAAIAWPSDVEIGVQFLIAAAGGTGRTAAPGAVAPLGVLASPARKTPAAEHNPLLDGALEALFAAAESVIGPIAQQAVAALPTAARAVVERAAAMFGVPFSTSTSTVTVVLEPRPGRSSTSTVAALSALGIGRTSIEASSNLIKVNVSLSQLGTLVSQLAGVGFIRPPYSPYPLGTPSQGAAAIGAAAYHSAGIRGSGAKIAVIDMGFAGLSQAQARGDLPYSVATNDLTGTGLTSGITHGTAVAEIIYDLAPEAELHLIKIADEVELDLAVTYCLDRGIDIINHSLGWYNTNFYDGTGTIAEIAGRAISGGIVWVNAAGNEAESHWEGTFTDGNADGWNDPSITFYASSGAQIILYLTWNEWPQSSTDYDLYLYDPASHLAASSTKHQTGTEEPTESLQIAAPLSGTYTIRVSGSGSRKLEIFSLYQTVSPAVASSSILAPANVADVVAVGAIDWANYAAGPQQPYSSQGPTNSGLTKPDLCAPDNVSTGTAPYTTFPGTSGAAPHATAAAALLLSQEPTLTGPGLRSRLLSNTIAMGSANIYGQGRLFLQPPSAPNQPPQAQFDVSTASPVVGASVAFDGRSSFDPDGTIASYTWSFGDGTTGYGSTTSHVYSSPGSYSARLTVTDNSGATDVETRAIVVSASANQPPEAAFTLDPFSPMPGAWVAFDAGGSHDPDGSIAAYAWQFGDGGTESGAFVFYSFMSAGTYTVRLTVTDNRGASDTATRTVVVGAPVNRPPTASFTYSPSSPPPGTWVSFNGSASGDPDGSIVSYAWNYGDGSGGSNVTSQHAYGVAGTYTVRLTVTDNRGASDTTTRTISISAPVNRPPIASFTYSPSSPPPGTWVSFNGSASGDPDGSIVSYAWNYGDGSSGSDVTSQHAYGVAGSYTVRLTVTDNRGASDTTTRTITIRAAARPDLTVQGIAFSPSSPTIGSSVTITATIRNVGAAPAGTFRVRLQGSASSTQTFVTQLAAGASRSISLVLPLTTSPETFTLTADDQGQVIESNEGNNAASITVAAAAPPPPVADPRGPYSGQVGSPIPFDGSRSTGAITTYSWTFGDGATGWGATPSHAYGSPGTYTVTLTVTGPGGQSTASTQAVVSPIAQPNLTAKLSLPKGTYQVGEAISVTVTLNRAAYVYLCDVSPDGTVLLLYPNATHSNNRLTSGVHEMPAEGAPYAFRISEPTGTETLYLFAATDPIPGLPTSFGGGFATLGEDPDAFRNGVLATMQARFPEKDRAFDSLAFSVVPAPTGPPSPEGAPPFDAAGVYVWGTDSWHVTVVAGPSWTSPHRYRVEIRATQPFATTAATTESGPARIRGPRPDVKAWIADSQIESGYLDLEFTAPQASYLLIIAQYDLNGDGRMEEDTSFVYLGASSVNPRNVPVLIGLPEDGTPLLPENNYRLGIWPASLEDPLRWVTTLRELEE